MEGVPVVHAEPSAKLPEWRPWPGEVATIAVNRPAGVTGSTLTIDESTYALRPGLRATDATLTLKLRSSRGAQHAITLPEGSILESVTIQGATTPIRQEGRAVTLPVAPGTQNVVVTWRMPASVRMLFRAPEVDLGTASVNATTTITMPEGRWVLALRGPHLGPVVLFWSLLGVVLAIAGAIGAMRRTPLATWEWMLLAVGLSQVHVIFAGIVVAWFHLVAWREQKDLGWLAFDFRQLAIAGLTLVTAVILIVAVHQGLLGRPDMQVSGNGSTSTELRWFTDRSEAVLTTPVVVSAPMLVYRVAMLGWALWLALSVLRWLRWAFAAFGSNGFWRPRPPRPVVPVVMPAYRGPPPPYPPQAPPQAPPPAHGPPPGG
jgi:hypothetical protein